MRVNIYMYVDECLPLSVSLFLIPPPTCKHTQAHTYTQVATYLKPIQVYTDITVRVVQVRYQPHHQLLVVPRCISQVHQVFHMDPSSHRACNGYNTTAHSSLHTSKILVTVTSSVIETSSFHKIYVWWWQAHSTRSLSDSDKLIPQDPYVIVTSSFHKIPMWWWQAHSTRSLCDGDKLFPQDPYMMVTSSFHKIPTWWWQALSTRSLCGSDKLIPQDPYMMVTSSFHKIPMWWWQALSTRSLSVSYTHLTLPTSVYV